MEDLKKIARVLLESKYNYTTYGKNGDITFHIREPRYVKTFNRWISDMEEFEAFYYFDLTPPQSWKDNPEIAIMSREEAKNIVKMKWISVEERLPEFSKDVIVCFEDDFYSISMGYVNAKGCFSPCFAKDCNGFEGHVSHWCEFDAVRMFKSQFQKV